MIVHGALVAAVGLTATAVAPPAGAVPAPTLGWSTRRVVPSYTGPCVRVVNDAGQETDIGFTAAGDLNVAAVAAHCGNGLGLVARWYNQGTAAGDGDLSQPQAGLRPLIWTGTGTPRVGPVPRPAVQPAGGWLQLGDPALTRVFPLTVSTVGQVGWGSSVEALLVGTNDTDGLTSWRLECAPTRRMRLRWVTAGGLVRDMTGATDELPVGSLFRATFRVAALVTPDGATRVAGHRRFYGGFTDRQWDGWTDHQRHQYTRAFGTQRAAGAFGVWSGMVAELVVWPSALADGEIDAFEASQVAYFRTK